VLGVAVDELPELGDELCVPEGLELWPKAQAVAPSAQLKITPEINWFFLILIKRSPKISNIFGLG